MKSKYFLLTSVLLLTSCSAQEVDPVTYYAELKQSCGTNRCCLTSVIQMKNGGYKEMGKAGCETGMQEDTLKCEGSKKWCKK